MGRVTGPDFQNLHRNKRSLTLDLKSDAGMKIFRQLAAKADVIVENFRPDVKNRLGVDYESIVQRPTRVWFMRQSPASVRTGLTAGVRGLIRLPRVWAA